MTGEDPEARSATEDSKEYKKALLFIKSGAFDKARCEKSWRDFLQRKTPDLRAPSTS